MPVFRIMGGNSAARTTNLTGNAARSTTSNSNSNNDNVPSNPAAGLISRSTYPGLRVPSSGLAAAPPPSMSMMSHQIGLPGQPPRVGGSLPSTMYGGAGFMVGGYAPSMNPSAPEGLSASSNSSSGISNVVVRGSTVGGAGAATSTLPPPMDSITPHVPPPASPVTTSGTNRPGAYGVTRTTSGPAQVYRVTVPPGVRPGAEFTVFAGTRRVRVRCPPTSKPGHSLQITLPPEPTTHNQLLRMAPLTCATDTHGGGGAVAMTPDVRRVNEAASESGGTAQTFLVTIPENVYAGMQFTVNVNGQRFMVTCPSNAGPNMKVRIVPPTQREEPLAAPKTQVFEVAVPVGVRPNQPFTLMANGQRVLVTCPPNVVPGQKIRFQLPVQQVVGSIQLSYEGENGGWCRTIRVNDLKFQWVRVNKKEEEDTTFGDVGTNMIDEMKTFDFGKAAYVRKIQMMEGNDARLRTGIVTLVPAQESVVDSKLVYNSKTLLSYADIANIQTKSLEEKHEWFKSICHQMTCDWDDGHIKIVVRRHSLLNDSLEAVMSLSRDDMRKKWRVEFLGEPAIDAGGPTREFFQLLTEQMFEPDFGLWSSSVNNQACMTVNPASGITSPDDHLIYFRFLGRIMGRALFDQQIIKGHMVRHLYKHLLGWPVTFEDLEAQDEDYYSALKKFTTMDDLSILCLDFTITEESMGARNDVELIPGGNMKEVTAENLPDYLEANLKYRMLDRTRPQITELLLGFFDIVPEPALTVFDPNELELILCGLPEIDLDDWISNTIYSGSFEGKGRREKVVEWFWEVVRDDFDREMKARLLQFVTGTSGVPPRGFSVLQGNDGNIKKFAIHGVDVKQFPYPRAHTCFNRIDLPNYKSKKDLYERLKMAITYSSTGFDLE